MELSLPEGDERKKQLLSADGDVEAVARSVLGQGGPTRAGHRRFFDLEVENLVGHLRKAELAKYLEQNIEALQANQQITQVGCREFERFVCHDFATGCCQLILILYPVLWLPDSELISPQMKTTG